MVRRYAGSRLALVAAAVLATQVVLAPPALAPPGDLDPTFGTGGTVVTDFGMGNNPGFDLALQSNDRFIIAGGATNGTDLDLGLARYTKDGALDPSYGSGGKVTTSFGGNDRAFGIAVQSDGKAVAVGTTGSDFAVARYLGDGSLDPSFGSGGKATTDLGAGTELAGGVAVQPDGRIVVGGTSGSDFAVARYNADGSLDSGFGSGGKVVTDLGGTEFATRLALQANGKVVMVGTSTKPGIPVFALVRYTATGALDATFGTGGVVLTDVGPGGDVGSDLAIQDDGKIVAVGEAFTGTGAPNVADFAVVRYDPDGSLDSSFGAGAPDAPFASGGKVITDFAVEDAAYAVTVQSNGKIVAVGRSHDGTKNRFALARYTKAGALDPKFRSDGKVITEFPGNAQAFAVAIQSSGRIVAGGSAQLPGSAAPAAGDDNPDVQAAAGYTGDEPSTVPEDVFTNLNDIDDALSDAKKAVEKKDEKGAKRHLKEARHTKIDMIEEHFGRLCGKSFKHWYSELYAIDLTIHGFGLEGGIAPKDWVRKLEDAKETAKGLDEQFNKGDCDESDDLFNVTKSLDEAIAYAKNHPGASSRVEIHEILLDAEQAKHDVLCSGKKVFGKYYCKWYALLEDIDFGIWDAEFFLHRGGPGDLARTTNHIGKAEKATDELRKKLKGGGA